jgi:hypothetical protein
MLQRRGLQAATALTGILLLTGVAGCGGGNSAASEEAAASGPPLSKAEFVKRATAICDEYRKKFISEVEAFSRKSGEEELSNEEAELATLESIAIPGLEAQTAEVRSLWPPSADRKRVDEVLSAVERVLREAREDPSSYFQRLSHFKRPFHRAHELAKAYGLQACAKG